MPLTTWLHPGEIDHKVAHKEMRKLLNEINHMVGKNSPLDMYLVILENRHLKNRLLSFLHLQDPKFDTYYTLYASIGTAKHLGYYQIMNLSDSLVRPMRGLGYHEDVVMAYLYGVYNGIKKQQYLQGEKDD